MSGPIDLPRVRAALAGAGSSALECSRRAAVALVLGPREDELCVLLVRRSEREDNPWSGHMALPGGLAHAADVDLLHTARRETLEEVGLDLERAELLGGLDDVSPMRSSELAVRPFVFWLAEPGAVQLSQIAEALWLPLVDFARPSLRVTRQVDVCGSRLRVPAHVIDDRVVWGMTLRLLDDFLGRIQQHG